VKRLTGRLLIKNAQRERGHKQKSIRNATEVACIQKKHKKCDRRNVQTQKINAEKNLGCLIFLANRASPEIHASHGKNKGLEKLRI